MELGNASFPPAAFANGGSLKQGSTSVFRPVPSRPAATLAPNGFTSTAAPGILGSLNVQNQLQRPGGLKNVNSAPSLPSMVQANVAAAGAPSPALQAAILNSIKKANPADS